MLKFLKNTKAKFYQVFYIFKNIFEFYHFNNACRLIQYGKGTLPRTVVNFSKFTAVVSTSTAAAAAQFADSRSWLIEDGQ